MRTTIRAISQILLICTSLSLFAGCSSLPPIEQLFASDAAENENRYR
jgi:hypothetical protein